jgi:hypothetical protein
MTKSRRMRWTTKVANMRDMRNAYRFLVRKPEWKRPLGRPRQRWKDNNKINLKEKTWEGLDSISLAQDEGLQWAVVNMVINLWVP